MTLAQDSITRAGAVAGHPQALPASGRSRASGERDLVFAAMGGRVHLHVTCPGSRVGAVDRDLRMVAGRIGAWAGRLTRFSPDSDLSALNRDPSRPVTVVRPTLYAVMERSLEVAELTEGIVDVGLLEARLAAETGAELPAEGAPWGLDRRRRGGLVHRDGPVRFDLDGVGKGWIADRALALLSAYPAALVDADGDVAVRTGAERPWTIAIADPRRDGVDIATLDLAGGRPPHRLGVATSGTSVHRWQHVDGSRHHLIDPRTGRPAVTDVVQATVVAGTALAAESLAKSIVISGSWDGLELAERAGARAAVLLLEDGEVIATPQSLDWLA